MVVRLRAGWIVLTASIALDTGLVWGANATVTSAVVRDGSVGAGAILQPRLTAGEFVVDETMGLRPGGGENLFHSFERFDLAAEHAVRFTAQPSLPTARVISRVTGGSASHIHGAIVSDIPQADFYFLNPRGVLFGADASIDVGGAFVATTATSLSMLPDDPDGLVTFTPEARLATANPIAFGFMGPAAVLSVDGARLQVGRGQTLRLIGGDVTLGPDTLLRAGDGSVELAAVGAAGGRVPDDSVGWTPGPGA